MYIKNLTAVVNALATDKDLLMEAVKSFEEKAARKGNYYSCSYCGSKDNLQVYEYQGVWYCKCHTYDSCFTGTVVQFIEKYKGLNTNEAVQYLIDKFNANVKLEVDTGLQALEKKIKTMNGQKEYTYDRHHYYKSKTGAIAFVKIIYKNGEGKKSGGIYNIIEKNGVYEIDWSASPKLPLLYNLHKIEDDKVLCITEGEKDADTLAEWGFIATTALTSNDWKEEYTTQVENIDTFYIFKDNDITGDAYANLVIENLKSLTGEYNDTKTIKVINIPYANQKEDITDYINTLKNRGKSKCEIKEIINEHIEYSENIVDLRSLHQDDKGIYKWKYNKSYYEKEYVTNFNIISADEVREQAYDNQFNKALLRLQVKPCIKNKGIYGIYLNGEERLERKKFNLVLQNQITNARIYEGDKKDFDRLLDYITRYLTPLNEKIIFQIAGVHEIEGINYFVTGDGAMVQDGNFTSEYQSKTEKGNRSSLYPEEDLTKEELKWYLKHIFKFYSEEVSIPILLWTYSMFYRYKYIQSGIKTSDLMICGLAGAGKSEIDAKIIQPHFNNFNHSAKNVSGGTTTLPLHLCCCYDNFTPITFNEVGTAAQLKQTLIYNLTKQRYDNEVMEKGKKNMKTEYYPVHISPAIYLSETGFEDVQQEKALNDRLVKCQLFLNKRTDEHTENYKELSKNGDIIAKVGKALLLQSMKTKQDILDEERVGLSVSIQPIKRITDRIEQSAILVMQGYMLLKKVCKNYEIDLDTYISFEDAYKILEDNFIDQNLNGGQKAKNHITQSIEKLCDYMIAQENNKEKIVWLVKDNILWIPGPYYTQIERYADVMKKTAFGKSCAKEGYIVNNDSNITVNATVQGHNTRFYRFKLDAVAHLESVKELLALKNYQFDEIQKKFIYIE